MESISEMAGIRDGPGRHVHGPLCTDMVPTLQELRVKLGRSNEHNWHNQRAGAKLGRKGSSEKVASGSLFDQRTLLGWGAIGWTIWTGRRNEQ